MCEYYVCDVYDADLELQLTLTGSVYDVFVIKLVQCRRHIIELQSVSSGCAMIACCVRKHFVWDVYNRVYTISMV